MQRETRRLCRVFGALVLAAAPLALLQACGTSKDDAAPAGHDVSTGSEASPDVAPAGDATTAGEDGEDGAIVPFDAACQVNVETLDAGPDVDPPCRYTLPCGLPDDNAFVLRGCQFYRTQPDDGGDASLGCWIAEENGCTNDLYSPPPSGTVTFQCYDCLGGGGRRPWGLRRPRLAAAPSALAAYFARMAHDEAASITAFDTLAADLGRHGAPRALIAGAMRSARDEVRHAMLMGTEARTHGVAHAVQPRVKRARARSLEAVARENATEGCVNETFGALLMHWQALHAQTPALRALFSTIATDETRHAALSGRLANWTASKLPPLARRRVEAARSRALAALRGSLEARGPAAFDAAVGYPCRAACLALFDGMVPHLVPIAA